MAKIHPFKAIRPTRDKAQLVSTRPLAAYRKHILQAKLDENPYTFLHIIHPEGEKDHQSKANTMERFVAVRERFEQFVSEGILIQDEIPGFYIYRQTKGDKVFTGLIAGASIEEYNTDKIKKHEATITQRESMFTNYLNHTGFNAEPVLLAHEHSDELDALIETCTSERPEYEFSTTDKIKHEVWNVSGDTVGAFQAVFEPMKALYIADGHHRSASSARLKQTKVDTKEPHFINHDFFLAYLIDEEKLEIVEFNRIVKHLNNLTQEQFIEKLKANFQISELSEVRNPLHEHEIICILDQCVLSLIVKPELLVVKDAVHSLDAQMLTDFILDPILGIEDLKTSKDIDFIPGTRPIEDLKEMVDLAIVKAAFVLYPLHMNHVKAVADEGKIMPPKSTWVEPKMRSGLTVYRINE